jgi:phage/plasmid-associated DNA primase
MSLFAHNDNEPVPMNLIELYDPHFRIIKSTKYAKELLFRHEHMRKNATDIADMVISLYEDSAFLAFSNGKETNTYMTRTSGVWDLVDGKEHHELYNVLSVISNRLNRSVIVPVKELLSRLSIGDTSAASSVSSSKKKKKRSAEQDFDNKDVEQVRDHLDELTTLYDKLRTPAFASGIVKRMVTSFVMDTREKNISASMMDVAKCCISFDDGVFDFREGKLAAEILARNFLQTLTVKYRYEDMMNHCTPSVYDEYNEMVGRIYESTPGVRTYLTSLFASSALNENRQCVVFHHNVTGGNGKTTFFSIVRMAFGDTFMKCDSKMLAPATFVNSSGPNEELMSCKGKRIVLVSEPSSNLKLSSSFIKELTGGDEQSSRGMHGKKQTFVFNGMLHVLCNKIPEMDADMCGGCRRRVRCIPYGSVFTDKEEEVDEEKHVYKMVHNLDAELDKFKYCLMKDVVHAAAERVRLGYPADDPPPIVVVATNDLISREGTVHAFITRHIIRTKVFRDKLTLKDAYDAYCKRLAKEDNGKKAERKGDFKLALIAALGQVADPSNGLSNFWKGVTLKKEETEVAPTADEEEPGDVIFMT